MAEDKKLTWEEFTLDAKINMIAGEVALHRKQITELADTGKEFAEVTTKHFGRQATFYKRILRMLGKRPRRWWRHKS